MEGTSVRTNSGGKYRTPSRTRSFPNRTCAILLTYGRTDAAKRFKKVESAIATIFKLLLVAEKNFRRLNAPELMREVHLGVRFEDGDRVTESLKVAAA